MSGSESHMVPLEGGGLNGALRFQKSAFMWQITTSMLKV